MNTAFEMKVSKNVYWVPVRILGDTKYKNVDIKKMLHLPPEQKRSLINNLYEALQLFQLSGFKNILDIQLIKEGTFEWEHHKPGFHAVRTNEGCCSSDASWLCYILESKYEEVGYFSVTQMNGHGHALNYIKHDSWYYFIDLWFHENEQLKNPVVETGARSDYIANKYITAKFHKARSPLDFAMMYRTIYWHQAEPIFFIHNTIKLCPPLSINIMEDKTLILYPNNTNSEIIYQQAKQSKIQVNFVTPPQCIPQWSEIPDGIG